MISDFKLNVDDSTKIDIEIMTENPNMYVNLKELVERFVELVKNNFSDATLNVEAIAERLGVHRTTLSRLVTKQLKRSPHQYLMSFRVQYGMTLLKGTDLPISEIAIKCGIPNKTHFASIIHKSVKMSPSAYRFSDDPIE